MRDVFQTASALHDAVIAEMTAQGVTLPKVQYVSPGSTVAYDGEQITTHVNRVYAGAPGAEDAFDQGSFVYMSLEMQVTIVRYTPDITDGPGGQVITPSAAQIQASAVQTMQDITALSQALVNIKVKGLLVPQSLPSSVGPVMSDGPQGGVVATLGMFTIPLL